MKRICLTALAFLGLVAALSAQIMNGDSVPEQAAKPLTPGELSPFFWIGGQAITTVGKNFETGASGMSYSSNQTWVSFNVAFVDSHYDTPKKIVSTDDPQAWSLSFKLVDPTARINSYSASPEINYPSWLLGVHGFGWRFGYGAPYNQPNGLIVGGDTANKPTGTLSGANQALYLGQLSAGSGDGIAVIDPIVKVNYSISQAAYAAYEVPGLYRVALTAGTAATDESTASEPRNAFAGVLDFSLRPWGEGSYDEPLTLGLEGNLIAGREYTSGNPIGFGLQTQLDYFLDDDVSVSPLLAFDGRVNDTWTPGLILPENSYGFDWKASGGLLIALSQKQWAGDAYGELPGQASFANIENAKIQKFTYLQVMADSFRQKLANNNRDTNFVVKFEEPDGILGLDDNWGLMAEFRVGNLLEANPGVKSTWSAIGRISYDLAAHTVTPYLRWYRNSDDLTKLRIGVQLAPVKGAALEVTYMTTNLTKVSSSPADQGRLEILLGLATDSGFRLPKNMLFNYEGKE